MYVYIMCVDYLRFGMLECSTTTSIGCSLQVNSTVGSKSLVLGTLVFIPDMPDTCTSFKFKNWYRNTQHSEGQEKYIVVVWFTRRFLAGY
jgi:hypothetical protein